MVNFITKTFAQLNTTELYQLLKLRADVFVVEQQCIYSDMDENDYKCLHVLGFEKERLVAYARLVPQQLIFKEASIGRVLTEKSVRRFGYGKHLMAYCIAEAQHQFSTNTILISAQQYLELFYADFGFITEGNMYLEDDIPHIKMRYIKNASEKYN